MNEYELLENLLTVEYMFLLGAAATPEIDINYTDQTITFNTTKTYDRDIISSFISNQYANIENFEISFSGTENEMTETQRTNITWMKEQLRNLEQYLNIM